MAGQELSLYDAAAFAAVNPEMRRDLQRNLSDGTMIARDLPQIILPTGRSKNFGVPGLAGIEEMPELEGVIIYKRPARFLYEKTFEEEPNTPPICFSRLEPNRRTVAGEELTYSEVGQGKPGGKCVNCVLGKFDGREPPKCAQRLQMFILRPGTILPCILSVPPTGLKNMRNYMMRLSMHGTVYHDVITKFKLSESKNAGNITFMKMDEPQLAGMMEPETRDSIRAYIEMIRPWLMDTQPVDDDMQTRETAGNTTSDDPVTLETSDDDFPTPGTDQGDTPF
jgi:hypothetical protein